MTGQPDSPVSLKDDLLKGADEAAAYTGLARALIYRLAAAGEIPCIRMGRNIYFRKSELDASFRSKPE